MIYSTEPAGFKRGIDVVGCYIEHAGTFLLLYRQPHKPNGNKWGMPAGKVDIGETKNQAMIREVREETGIEIAEADLQYFDSVFVQHEGTDFIYHMFSVQLIEQPKLRLVHKNIRDLDGCHRLKQRRWTISSMIMKPVSNCFTPVITQYEQNFPRQRNSSDWTAGNYCVRLYPSDI